VHITRQVLVYLLLAWAAPLVLAEEAALHVSVPTQSLAGALDSLVQPRPPLGSNRCGRHPVFDGQAGISTEILFVIGDEGEPQA